MASKRRRAPDRRREHGDKKASKVPAKRTPSAALERQPAPRKVEDEVDVASRPSPKPTSFPVVGIGASAGGLAALEEFFENVPLDSGMAYVVVTHQAPGRATLLPELLARRTQLPVALAADGVRLQANHAYIAPPGSCLTVEDEHLQVEPQDTTSRLLPIDQFFRSIAYTEGESAIAVMLSGNGSDGSIGIAAVKGAAGLVLAQDPKTAQYPGMPASAIATQVVDYVLRPSEMPERLVRFVRSRARLPAPALDQNDEDVRLALQRVLVILRNRTGSDFTAYKKSTIGRRIERRMTVHGISNPGDYARFLEQAPYEVDALFKELLISVTSFFRDPAAFESLEHELVKLTETKADDSPLRAWVPACSSGEEAYSLAILIREVMQRTGRDYKVQIFATDLDPHAIEIARSGHYSEGISADIRPDRLQRFFTKDDSGYRVNKDVREMLVFAVQNAIKDPPFTKLDLVSCRNLLIYLEPELQRRLLILFGYALRPGGLLMLGTSESVSGFDDRFAVLDKRWKLFQRRQSGSQVLPDMAPDMAPAVMRGITHVVRDPMRANTGVGVVAERILLSSFAPPAAIISERGELIYLHGRTGPFLEPAPGEPSNNVFHMAREGLRLELPAAVRQAATSNGPVTRRGLQVKTNGGFSPVAITVRRLADPESLRGTYLVSFEIEPELERRAKGKTGRVTDRAQDRIASIEGELQRTKENLQGTIEELETSNEELKSTNEELQSTNEELQSANEELETSREEMQSLNEELQTVNAELEERNRALSQANDDMQNLLNSIEVATVFLDDKLAIKRFTTQAKKVFSLIETDIGRPISDLTANLRYDRLVDDAREVMRTLVFSEREIQTKEGSWRLMRIMPYRTYENLIDGLVMTFIDVDRMKRAENEAQAARAYAEAIVDSVTSALLVIDHELRVMSANRAFHELFRTSAKQVVGEMLPSLLEGIFADHEIGERLRRVLAGVPWGESYRLQHTFQRGGAKQLSLDAHKMTTDGGRPPLVLLTIDQVI